jgi:succinate dehydrogenase / fumarate reductase cytochrome b subunit
MIPIKKALTSSLGKKYIMAITGVGLLGFIVMHLLGNLTLYYPDSTIFNTYAKSLHDLGPLLWAAEVGLAAMFGTHFAMAVWLQLDKQQARYKKYEVVQTSKGGNSRFGLASNRMIWTGGVLALFLPLHIMHFKFGLFGSPDETVMINGEEARDLYLVVQDAFAQWPIALSYVAVMLFLGLHLRHGFWSWIQSLGAMKPEWSGPIHKAGLAFGVLIAAGFIGIPFYFLLDVPGMLS